MKLLGSLLFFIVHLTAFAQEISFPTVLASSKGVLVYWSPQEGFEYSVYRSQQNGEFELLQEKLKKAPYHDEDVQSLVEYQYKVVAESKSLKIVPEFHENLIMVTDFRTGECIGEPKINCTNARLVTGPNPPFRMGLGILSSGGKTSSYERYLSTIKTGKKYLAKISYSGHTGCRSVTLSLSPRKPVANVVIDLSGDKKGEMLRDKDLVYELTGGPNEWNTFSIAATPFKNSGCIVYLKRIELFEKP